MSDDERTIGNLRVQIDRTLCVGFGDCITEAPEAFRLDGDGIAVFVDPPVATRDLLVRACESCPVDAIALYDETGHRIAP
jgi:ferredoxin